MCLLLKIVFLSIIVECIMDEQQCMSFNRRVSKCQDWKTMSELVSDLVGRSSVNDDKIKTKSNMLTLLIRAASGVIGRGTDALKTVIFNGLVLLIQTILTVSNYGVINKDTSEKAKFVPDGQPIDWILNNPYIKSMVDDATDETLPDKLERLTSGMPCFQLLVCRLSPIIHNMQRLVKDGWRGPRKRPAWNVTDWQRLKGDARRCAEKHRECAETVKPKSFR